MCQQKSKCPKPYRDVTQALIDRNAQLEGYDGSPDATIKMEISELEKSLAFVFVTNSLHFRDDAGLFCTKSCIYSAMFNEHLSGTKNVPRCCDIMMNKTKSFS